jgi:uncharacterized protein YbaR (Trm112 family)
MPARDGADRGAATTEGTAMAIELDPQLLQVLACPDTHHTPLTPGTPADPDAAALSCPTCGRTFPVRDGIPVLLLDEADGGPQG